MDDLTIIELYKKEIEIFLGTMNVFKGNKIVNKDKKLNSINKEFIKNKMIELKSGNVNLKLLDIAIDELLPYLFQK